MSDSINRSQWVLQMSQAVRKKFLLLLDHWMKPPGVQIAEIVSKMFATWQARSDPGIRLYNVAEDTTVLPMSIKVFCMRSCPTFYAESSDEVTWLMMLIMCFIMFKETGDFLWDDQCHFCMEKLHWWNIEQGYTDKASIHWFNLMWSQGT